jgi:hypothetical protein
MPTTTYNDNAFAPGLVHDSYVPDQLIAGNFMLETQPIIVFAGALKRGTVLGRVNIQGVTSAPFATNTGNATLGTLSRAAGSKQGNYVITATDATHFSVTDPEGVALPAAVAGTAYAQQGILFTITAGGTAMVAGDGFTLKSYDATGQYIACVKTASDGSQTPVAILVDDVDASVAPAAGGAYLTGEFNDRAIIYDASWTLAQLRDAFRPYSIFLKASVSAADAL